ncbi:zinc-binding dehydrogenase [Actinoplanes sp. NBRC 101535]|uniref:zinc-binding dehydrogenase n=1 Tax=Actinoplanes sp. NBRC 101535 TaxID=3032196 RepID=UPI0024A383FE|nr:zinc-binding dehydrogenase [Actinoplanes sp. NBRC 101535]GLY01852.1 oxidoreductase [Actinoplanes sp. NBRC 101535]
MQAIAIERFGGPDGLAVVDLPDPTPGPGRMLVATEAIGVGGVDVMIRSGALAAHGFREGHVPGGEIAGTVTAVGDGVDPIWIGQRVWAFTGSGGGYAQRAVVPADEVLPLPDDLPATAAVTLGSAGIVAHFGLAQARFSAGDSVLVRGAAGSLGIMTVQLAARAGASAVAVTTSSPERGRRLRELGATHVLDRSGQGDPRSFDVVVDVVAGPDLPAFLNRLNPNGRLVLVGAVAGPPPASLAAALMAGFQRSLTVATFSAATVALPDRRSVRAAHLAAAARGDLQPVVHDVLPLSQAAEAHRRMDSGEVFGRIVLTA